MALIKCPECGKEVSNKAVACPYCGMPFIEMEESLLSKYICLKCGERLPENILSCPKCGTRVPDEKKLGRDMLYCPECEGLNEIGSFSCAHCGRKYKAAELASCIIKENKNEEKQQQTILTEGKGSNQARCPRCGSTSLAPNKKGYGVGKAVVGTALLGILPGVFIGGMGRNKIEVTCLKCGKKFKV